MNIEQINQWRKQQGLQPIAAPATDLAKKKRQQANKQAHAFEQQQLRNVRSKGK